PAKVEENVPAKTVAASTEEKVASKVDEPPTTKVEEKSDAKASTPGTGDAKPAETDKPPDPYDAVKARDIVNPLNTAWVLLGAFLVFGMQAGFTMLEAGFCRSRETVNVLVECVFDTCVCGLLHWAWGFAFMFGEGNAWIGWHEAGNKDVSYIFMSGVTAFS